MLNQVSLGNDRALAGLLLRSRWRLRLTRRWETQMPGLLAQLGEHLQVSRSYLFQNFEDASSGELCARQRFEWVEAGVGAEIDNPELQASSYHDIGCAHWITPLSSGVPVVETIGQATGATAELMAAQGIKALMVAPLIGGSRWWGFLGVDDCAVERQWRDAERKLLMGIGAQIGQLLQRRVPRPE